MKWIHISESFPEENEIVVIVDPLSISDLPLRHKMYTTQWKSDKDHWNMYSKKRKEEGIEPDFYWMKAIDFPFPEFKDK